MTKMTAVLTDGTKISGVEEFTEETGGVELYRTDDGETLERLGYVPYHSLSRIVRTQKLAR